MNRTRNAFTSDPVSFKMRQSPELRGTDSALKQSYNRSPQVSPRAATSNVSPLKHHKDFMNSTGQSFWRQSISIDHSAAATPNPARISAHKNIWRRRMDYRANLLWVKYRPTQQLCGFQFCIRPGPDTAPPPPPPCSTQYNHPASCQLQYKLLL